MNQPAQTVFLQSAQTSGLEVAGSFARRDGSIWLELTFANHANQPVGDFAIQFNKNTFGLGPAAPLQVPSPIPPRNATNAAPLLLQPNTPSMVQPSSPLTNIQVALRCSAGVFYFQTLISLHVFFAENGMMGQSEFLREFADIPDNEQRNYLINNIPSDVSSSVLKSDGTLRNKLAKNNVFVVAQRNISGVEHYYCSVRLLGGSLFVMELKVSPDGSAIAISTKSRTPQELVSAFHDAIESIILSSAL
ncbi:clathrin adaptor appendage domain-containing protein [Ramicandelaber brevisporus]|nr:clathrin adaptor appendage domain-containing protein [Ramicandelaber brevisporus]